MGIGRFKFVTTEWKSFNLITVPEEISRENPLPFMCDYPSFVDDTSLNYTANGSRVVQYKLYQNYQTPFNIITTIPYYLYYSCYVNLIIYNLLGQKVRTLVEEEKSAGFFTAHWDGSDEQGHQLPSGVYLYRFQAGNFVAVKKMALLH